MDKHTLSELIKMAEFSYEHSKKTGAHQEFLSDDRDVLNKARKYLSELSEGKARTKSARKVCTCRIPDTKKDSHNWCDCCHENIM